MSIPEYATTDHTLAFAEGFAEDFSPLAYRHLGRTGLAVSRLGFGTYRCHAEVDAHKEALRLALQSGCNLIDTSANYGDGMAEVLIGEVLNEAVVWEGRPRGQYVVVSKVGYVQGENLDIAQTRESEDHPFPELVKLKDGLWHCIHPEFIEDQITRSLARMHLDTLDVYLLHNPEYFLIHAEQSGLNRAAAEKQFYSRLRRAFMQMEKLVRDGLIRWYGISSNSFPLPASHAHHVSLEKVWTAYCDACLQLGTAPAEGHFGVIQLPYNLSENGAATLENTVFNDQPMSVLALAKRLELGVLCNRPLNAIHENHLLRLASYGFDPGQDYRHRFETALESLESAEDELVGFVAGSNLGPEATGHSLREFLQMSVHLRQISRQEMDVSSFRMLVEQRLGPLMLHGRRLLSEQSTAANSAALARMIDRYFGCFQQAADDLLYAYDSENFDRIAPLYKPLESQYPEQASLNVAQKALYAALQQRDIDAVLVGMRLPAYVSDALPVLSRIT